jgi:methionine synthase II (cobalamin-independent)
MLDGHFATTGSYHNVAVKLFQQMKHNLFYLEYDTDRAGDFTPLQHLPVGKAVVLGIVTTKNARMETLGELKAKVLQAADVIARGQGVTRDEVLQNCLAVSPQCGFSSISSAVGIGMSEDDQWEKLELVKQLAEDLWPKWRHNY